MFSFTDDKPLYLQIAEQLEDAIFTGAYEEETQIPSTTERPYGTYPRIIRVISVSSVYE